MQYNHSEFSLIDELNQRKYVIDNDNVEIVNICAVYFDNRIDISAKGIYLFSSPGTGKSALFKIAHHFVWWKRDFNRFEIIHARELAHNFGRLGFEAFDIHQNIDLLIDDLGSEPVFKYFGSEVNPLAEFIDLRYEKFPKLKTHFTSNFAPAQLEKRYGVRILSRLKEMCNSYQMKGNDRRG